MPNAAPTKLRDALQAPRAHRYGHSRLHTITWCGQLVAPSVHSVKSQSIMVLHSIRQLAPSVQLAPHEPGPLQRMSHSPPLQTVVQVSAPRQSTAHVESVHPVAQLPTLRQSTLQLLSSAQVRAHAPGVSSQSRSQSQPPQVRVQPPVPQPPAQHSASHRSQVGAEPQSSAHEHVSSSAPAQHVPSPQTSAPQSSAHEQVSSSALAQQTPSPQR